MDAKAKADEFVSELKSLISKHYGSFSDGDVEPLGMLLRQALPVVDVDAAAGVTTTATVSIPWDTDPADDG